MVDHIYGMTVPIAIRSLQCPDHAYHLPPHVFGVSWFVGKRCNYDCSYCGPHTHDAVSPFMDLGAAQHFADQLDRKLSDSGRQSKWSFTGGEPFVDPGFLDLVRYVSRKSTTLQMNTVTNGSLPLTVYETALSFFTGITVSLHLERRPEEIDSTLNKILALDRAKISVNLMCLPGRLDQVRQIYQRLCEADVSVVVRRISPPVPDTQHLPWNSSGTGRKTVRLLPLDQQSEAKAAWKIKADNLRGTSLAHYYSPEESQFLQQVNHGADWTNCGVWFDDGSYRELNSDVLVSNDQNSFKGWRCWAGVDSIYIDYDGRIYRGMCMNAGPIGHITNGAGWAEQPTVCEKNWCLCNFDIASRKCNDQGRHHVDR